MNSSITLTKNDCKVIELQLRKHILDEEVTQLQLLRAYDRVFVEGDKQNVKFYEISEEEAWSLLIKRMAIYEKKEFYLWLCGIKSRHTDISNKYVNLYCRWEKLAQLLTAATPDTL